jgi:hypothetical protein
MKVRASLVTATVVAVLATAPMVGLAQSQADRTGTGGVAAGQEGSSGLVTTAVIAGAVIAAAVGIAVAVGSNDDNGTQALTTVTSTTTR